MNAGFTRTEGSCPPLLSHEPRPVEQPLRCLPFLLLESVVQETQRFQVLGRQSPGRRDTTSARFVGHGQVPPASSQGRSAQASRLPRSAGVPPASSGGNLRVPHGRWERRFVERGWQPRLPCRRPASPVVDRDVKGSDSGPITGLCRSVPIPPLATTRSKGRTRF